MEKESSKTDSATQHLVRMFWAGYLYAVLTGARIAPSSQQEWSDHPWRH